MGSNALREDGYTASLEEFERLSLENYEGAEAEALETGLEGLSDGQRKLLLEFDGRIDTELRRLDFIEHMEQTDPAWRNGMDYSMQVIKIRTLKSEIADCGIQHADDANFSALILEKVDLLDQRLTKRLDDRANNLLKELDDFERDVLKDLRR